MQDRFKKLVTKYKFLDIGDRRFATWMRELDIHGRHRSIDGDICAYALQEAAAYFKTRKGTRYKE